MAMRQRTWSQIWGGGRWHSVFTSIAVRGRKPQTIKFTNFSEKKKRATVKKESSLGFN